MTAMAMSCRPDLIIFDEPTTALDVTTQVEVLAAIAISSSSSTPRRSTSRTIWPSSRRWRDRIMVLRYGKLVEEATTREMLSSPREDYTKSLWAVRALHKTEERPSDDVAAARATMSTASYGGEITVLRACDRPGAARPHRRRRRRDRAPANRRWRASSPACCRRLTGEIVLRRQAAAAGAQGSRQGHAAAHADDLSDRRIPRSIRASACATSSAGRSSSISALRAGRCDRKVVELLDLIELDESFLDRLPRRAVGRPEAAHLHRPRAGRRARAHHLRRGDLGARSDRRRRRSSSCCMRLQKETSVSYLFITHDIATVRAIADEIVVMHQGKVVQQGPKSQVLSPPHPALYRSAALLGAGDGSRLADGVLTRRTKGAPAMPAAANA